MKSRIIALVSTLALILGGGTARPNSITWTNTSGGNWGGTSNWSPNQVPGPTDVAVITNDANYAVTLDVSPSIGGLVLGATGGASTQTLNTAGQNLTVNGVIQVNSQGSFNFNGRIYGVFAGTSVLVGTMTVSGGFLEGTITVSSNSVLNIAVGAGNYVEWEGLTLTNNGTVNWTNTAIYSGYGQQNYVYNYGLWNEQSDDHFYGGYYLGGRTFFDNFGTLRKSGNAGTTTFDGNVTLNNTGTVDVESGTLELMSGNTNNLSGGTLNFGLNSPSSYGKVSISGAAALTGTLSASLNGGYIPNSTNSFAVLTYGSETGVFTSTNLPSLPSLPSAEVWKVNYGSTVATLQVWANITWTNTSGGNWSGTSNWSPNQVPGPTDVAVITNDANYTVTLDVSPSIGGLALGATGGASTQTLNTAGQSLTVNGVIQVNSQGGFNFNGGIYGVFAGTSVLVGTMTVSGGFLEGTITVSSNSVLKIAVGAGNYVEWEGLTLTNNGTVNWTNTAIYSGYGQQNYVYNYGLWNEQSDDYFYGGYQLGGRTFFDNFGTLRKSGNAGTTTFDGNVTLNNTGTVDVESGTLELMSGNTNNLSGGTLNFGLNSPSSYGKVSIFGAAVLTGTLSASLNGGYIPNSTNSFAVLTYGSETGVFTSTNLPFADAWQVNYGSSVATLQVLNSRPLLSVPPNQTIHELTLLTVTNITTDNDVPAQTLAFGLVAAPNGMTINTNTGVGSWTPSQSQSPSTNTILVSVTDNGTPPLSATNSFTVVVVEVNVAPVPPVIAPTNVNELTLLTVTNTAAESNIHSAVGYALVNPPAGMSISTNGIITWTPRQLQSPGTNSITTIVTNNNPYDVITPSLAATNSFTVIVKEINVAPTLSAISTQTINELTLLTVTNAATEFNIHSIITGYGLVNPPAGMSLSSSGIITWTPAPAQSPGTNTITTVVTNSNPYDLSNPQLTATNSITVIVKEVNVAPVLPFIPTQTVNALVLLTVTNVAIETNIHATVGYTLVNPPSNMVINASGIITWTPARVQGPSTNLVTTIVTNTDPYDLVNPHLSATNSFAVIVFAPTLAPNGNYSVDVGQTVSFTASAMDNDSTRTLTFSLGTAPGGASIVPLSGLFNWRPPVSSAGGSNIIQIVVTDNSTPALSATQHFSVSVNTLTPVTLEPVAKTTAQFEMQVTGPLGPDYILQANGTLANTNWLDLLTNTPAVSPFNLTETNVNRFTNRFYRVKLAP